ncbi:MAG: hypothetical protein Fur0021_18840 [Candidatus Promineifilaceae bacterium]
MPHKRVFLRKIIWSGVVAIFCLLAGQTQMTAAQTGLGSRLFITGSNTDSVPTVNLYVYGLDGAGQPLALTPATVVVQHNGEQAANVTVPGQVDAGAAPPQSAGTFTLFIVDTPPGVSDSLEAIRSAIESYASPLHMREEVDYVAIYQVGETGATQLLAPVEFHNSVKNFFAQPLPIMSGPTALVDSVMSLLTTLDTIKPHPGLAPAVVILSDGTDVVSTAHESSEVFQYAAEQGIPIHTIWLNNANLNIPEPGRAYLQTVAANARGLAGSLEDGDSLTAIWNRIAQFSPRTLIRYVIANPVGGDFSVNVSLANEPGVTASTRITVRANAPSVILNLPPENRTLSLPDLDNPVRLRLSATASWMDGTARTITRAQLLVNGLVASDINPTQLNDFQVEVSQFQFGENTLEVQIEDEQGLQATSPAVALFIDQGEEAVPGDMVPSNSFLRVSGWLVLIVIVLGGLAVAGYFLLSRQGRVRLPQSLTRLAGQLGKLKLPLSRLPRRVPRQTAEVPAAAPPPDEPDAAKETAPYLEVLESVTDLPRYIPIEVVETRLGRSPANSDVVFENDITVSRLHASIIYSEEQDAFGIYDEQSTSGTWVNNQPVPGNGMTLLDGDEIRLGAVRLVFHWR